MSNESRELLRFVSVDFRRFKAFGAFTLTLRNFNILVGANNAGKSTILAAFRILASGMRKAKTRKATPVDGPDGDARGYVVDLSTISVGEENIFYDYDDTHAASVRFRLNNGNELLLYFPEHGVCYLIPYTQGRPVTSPAVFRSNFNCEIGFVPILGPVDHNELLFEKEAARLALFNYRAARNFRNIWHHFPEKFEEFRSILCQTWPGMDIEPPQVDRSHLKARLHMFCPEERIPRELFWAGFGFQVWCQMLTHLIQSSNVSIFLIDEPDIYLHSDLQRQLLGLLKNLGPDILIATHSTEIIAESETDDIVLVNKLSRRSKRIKSTTQLGEVFGILGSSLNPVLTQLAKTRRVLFVEGKDFQIIGKFARKLNYTLVGSRRNFAVVPVDGFNPDRVRSLKKGMETTLGNKISAAVVLDKDYRSGGELDSIKETCRQFCDSVTLFKRKEIENYLLVPGAIDRAISRKIAEKQKRTGAGAPVPEIEKLGVSGHFLQEFSVGKRAYCMGQYLANRRAFERSHSPGASEASVNQDAIPEFDKIWEDFLNVIPGKEAVSALNKHIQETYGVNVTPTLIIESMCTDEVPKEMKEVIAEIDKFASS